MGAVWQSLSSQFIQLRIWGVTFSLVLWPVLDSQANPGQIQHFKQDSQQPSASNTNRLWLRQSTYAHGDRCHYALNSKQLDVTNLPKVCFQLFYRWLKQALVSKVAVQSHRSKGVRDLGLNTKMGKKPQTRFYSNSPPSVNQTTKEGTHSTYTKSRLKSLFPVFALCQFYKGHCSF